MTEAESREMTKQARRRARDLFTKAQLSGEAPRGGLRGKGQGYKRAKAGSRQKEW
jgi:hypothetical protein